MRRSILRALSAVDPRHLWRRYALALGLVLLLVSSSYYIAVLLLAGAGENARTINLSGLQRTLSQRILLESEFHTRDTSSGTAAALRATIDQFESAHRDLSQRKDLPEKVRFHFFEEGAPQTLDRRVKAFVAKAREILKGGASAGPALSQLQDLAGPDLVVRLNSVVLAFEKVAADQARQLAQVHNWTFIASVVTLLFEAVLIFFPAHVSLTRTLRRLERQNDDVERAAAEVEYQSLHDPLTGLGNRRFLDLNLERLTKEARRNSFGLALLHIDLDRFKQINDTLGHAAGDYVLTHVARTMDQIAKSDDVLARVGGDEFVLVRRTEDGSKEALEALAEHLIKAISQPVIYEDSICRFGASIGIGISIQGFNDMDPAKLLVNADIALYRAKENGRGRFAFYTKAMEQEVIRTKRMSDEILVGLEEGQFRPHYQPQVDARTHEIVGLEVLARWHHPREGILLPQAFLSVARDLNVMTQIDTVMLDQALLERARWRALGVNVPRLAFNVAMSGLSDGSLLENVERLGGEEEALSFELMEAIFFDDCDSQVLSVVQKVKELGFEIEIDDFGTGHASIISLLNIRPNRLKIDQQLVRPITSSSSRRSLVASIVEIGRSMGVEVIAEGVETMDHARILADLGCDILQGYAFAKALDAEQTLNVLRTQIIQQAS